MKYVLFVLTVTATLILAIGLAPFWGLWAFLWCVPVSVWWVVAAFRHTLMARQMRKELRQVLNEQ